MVVVVSNVDISSDRVVPCVVARGPIEFGEILGFNDIAFDLLGAFMDWNWFWFA